MDDYKMKHEARANSMDEAYSVMEKCHVTYGKFFNNNDEYFIYNNDEDIDEYNEYVGAPPPSKQPRLDMTMHGTGETEGFGGKTIEEIADQFDPFPRRERERFGR